MLSSRSGSSTTASQYRSADRPAPAVVAPTTRYPPCRSDLQDQGPARVPDSSTRTVACRSLMGPSLGRCVCPFVHVDEPTVVRRDLRHRGVAIESVRICGVCLDRLREDRAADRKADVTLETRAGTEPLVDLLVRSAAAEHDARDALASFATAELRDLAARLAIVDPLDLPDVGLDAGVLKLEDRLHHQLRPELRVVAVLV